MKTSIITAAENKGYNVTVKSAGRKGQRCLCSSPKGDINITQCNGLFSVRFVRKSSYVFVRPQGLYCMELLRDRVRNTSAWSLHNYMGSETLTEAEVLDFINAN